MATLLVTTILIPAVVAVWLLLDRQAPAARARWVALFATLISCACSWGLAVEYSRLPASEQVGQQINQRPVQPRFELRYAWLTYAPAAVVETAPAATSSTPPSKALRLEFLLGLDGISLLMVLMTTLLTVSAVLVSWNTATERAPQFYACLLLLETGLVGAFCAFDLMLFYACFEFTLIPLFFLVGVWGGALGKTAAMRFLLYTLIGSLVTLLGLVSLAVVGWQQTGLATPFSIPDLAAALHQQPLPAATQTLLFWLIAIGFLVKLPVFPFHTWLPAAYAEAPTAGSMLLSGVRTYGFVRLCLPMLPDACLEWGVPLVGGLAVAGILYGSLCAVSQNDLKRMIAYSSLAHLGFSLLGLFALNSAGISGGIMQMLSHGLSTGALFCLVGMTIERYQSRQISDLGGIATQLPRLGFAFVFITFASVGLPGFVGFVGEALALFGMFAREPVYGALGAIGVVLAAWYLLGMVQHTCFGPLKQPFRARLHHTVAATTRQPAVVVPLDLNMREMLAVVPLGALCLGLGFFPQPVLKLIEPDVRALAYSYEQRVSQPLALNVNTELTVDSAQPALLTVSSAVLLTTTNTDHD